MVVHTPPLRADRSVWQRRLSLRLDVLAAVSARPSHQAPYPAPFGARVEDRGVHGQRRCSASRSLTEPFG